MTHRVVLIPGDGIGPEISEATRRVIDATGVEIEWEVQEAGEAMIQRYGTPLPDQVLEAIRRTKTAIKGPITTPIGVGFRSVNVTLRKVLDLYTNLRPAKSYKGVRSRYDNVDVVVVRENTEDLYAGVEYPYNGDDTRRLIEFIRNTGQNVRDDSAISIKAISVTGSRRIVQFAFH